MKLTDEEYGNSLAHYGIRYKSGRYPWGSGENPLQRSKTFLDIVDDLKKNHGMTDPQIAQAYSRPKGAPPEDDTPVFTTADLRALRSIAVNEIKQDQIRTAQSLKEKGMGNSAIGRQMGVNESTVRSLLEPGRQEKIDIPQATADMLKREVETKEFLDVGANVERNLPIGTNPEARVGISADKFKTSLAILKEEGYNVHKVGLPQLGTGETTNYLVLTKPGVTQKEAFLNRDKIQPIVYKTPDGGKTWDDGSVRPPLSISSKRVGIRYKEDGGADADGVIFVRPGKEDLSLGKSRYAQVRIAVDGTHYLKGMAVYKDDLPTGVDLQFNTNKSNTGSKHDAMKPMKTDKDGNVDPDNPFGASIKPFGQIIGKNGKPTSVMNRLNDEGDWDKWSRTLSSQVLSKQSPELAERQLAVTYERRQNELAELKSLTNPLIKKKLLETFGDESDSAAVHLKAANMPRQANKVLLPSNHIKPTEVFAPTFHDGERVALIRFPHAGLFEIPELTVNNRGRENKKLLGIGKGGNAPDAILIHPKVAEHLSGADFDGDHVLVIPNDRRTIESKHPLDGLKNFDPRHEYPPYDGMRTIDGGKWNEAEKKVVYPTKPDGSIQAPKTTSKGHQMGDVTNLISDMTIKGANTQELARAVRHSMVIIDSEKHSLDYKRSAQQNGIRDLKRRYQEVSEKTGQPKGASTLITRATSPKRIPMRRDAKAGPGRVRLSTGTVDPRTGRKIYEDTGALRRDGTPKTFESTKLAETDDAFSLVSSPNGTRIEHVYAEHSNRLKAMGNEARREAASIKTVKASTTAKKTYAAEVAELNAQLDIALKNSPVERHAQVVANHMVAMAKRANHHMDAADERKLKGRALQQARLRTGAGKTRVKITPRQWEAIQAGAISNHRLEQILRNTDIDKLRELATPRTQAPKMTSALEARAKSMLASGYTLDEVADHLGVALSTLKSNVYKEEVS